MTNKIITMVALLGMTTITQAGFFDFLKTDEVKANEAVTKNAQEVVSAPTVDPDFTIQNQKLLRHDTVKRDLEFLKLTQPEINNILGTFEALESNLQGYEEQASITEIKNYFKSKYLIENHDLIRIKTRLNEALR